MTLTICVLTMTNRTRICSYVALALLIAQVALFLVSWLITAAKPEIAMHSLLSSEGLRWFFGRFVHNLATPVLVWLLLLSVAYGCVVSSGLGHVLKEQVFGGFSQAKKSETLPLTYRQRFALRVVLFELCLIIIVMLLLTAVPHAVLLSVTGQLFPSSFSASIVPVVAFSLCIFGITYGVMSGHFHSVPEVLRSLCTGIGRTTPLWLLYILAAELYYAVRFVFMI